LGADVGEPGDEESEREGMKLLELYLVKYILTDKGKNENTRTEMKCTGKMARQRRE